jgi:hypothetical protein
MRDVMPPQRSVLINSTQRLVALAPLLIKSELMRGAERMRRERDSALSGTALLVARAAITTASNGGRQASAV